MTPMHAGVRVTLCAHVDVVVTPMHAGVRVTPCAHVDVE